MDMPLKILALADGFGDSRASPSWYPKFLKWPAILALMTKGTEVIDLCRYGAGNEYMVSCLRENHCKADVIFLQWAIPNRLDLLLAHESENLYQWQCQIDADVSYQHNFQHIGNDRWWISSASTAPWASTYRDNMISQKQHQNRSKIWVEYAHNLLIKKTHGFLLTWDSHYLNDADVEPEVWIWHDRWKGMHDWRYHSQYRDLDLDVTQPIPLIHFDFIKRFILPRFDLPWRNERELDAVESMLTRHYNQYKDHKPS